MPKRQPFLQHLSILLQQADAGFRDILAGL